MAMPGDELAHPVGCGIGVLAQGPSDRFADEEILFGRLRQRVAEQPQVVGFILVRELRDERGTANPQVFVGDPSIHLWCDFSSMMQKDRPDQMRCDLIDGIPPRTFLDHAAIERHRLGYDEVTRAARDIDCEIFLLAMRQLPQAEYRALILLATGNHEALLHLTLDRFACRLRYSVK